MSSKVVSMSRKERMLSSIEGYEKDLEALRQKVCLATENEQAAVARLQHVSLTTSYALPYAELDPLEIAECSVNLFAV